MALPSGWSVAAGRFHQGAEAQRIRSRSPSMEVAMERSLPRTAESREWVRAKDMYLFMYTSSSRK
jgi:hypothetical protein